jgi:hypothetical protein
MLTRLKSKLRLLIAFGLLAPTLATAAPDCVGAPNRIAVVTAVEQNGNLKLADGQVVRLIGTHLVRLFPKASSTSAQGLNGVARTALDLLRRQTVGQQITLYISGRKRDRYDQLLAHVITPDGTWLQGRLLQEGLARAYSYADNRACIADMLALEQAARAQRKGLWGFPALQPVSADKTRLLLRRRYRFHLVEGTVSTVAARSKWTFINFSEDWRHDFTIAIARKYSRRIERAGLALSSLVGRRVRVRGWLESWNGPLIKVTHREQIELLPQD